MSQRKNKKIVEDLFQAFTKDPDAISPWLTEGFVWNPPAESGIPNDARGYVEMARAMRRALPDADVTIERMVAEDDWVATRFTVHGTHKGEFLGVPASGRKVTFTGMSMTRVDGKKVAADLTEVDIAAFLQQVGAMPTPAAASHA